MDSEIEHIYEMILLKITDGKLFGETVDLDNPKHVAVAMYMYGEYKGRQESELPWECMGK